MRSRHRDAIEILGPFSDSVTAVDIVPGGPWIAVASTDGKLRVFDVRNASVSVDDLCGITFYPPALFCCCLRTLSLMMYFYLDPLTSVDFSSDGAFVLVSSLGGFVRVLNRVSGEIQQEFRGHLQDRYRLNSCFSSDDCTIFSGSEDGDLFLWGRQSSALLGRIRAHISTVTCVRTHPQDTSTFLSASSSGEIKLWQSTRSSDLN